MPPLSDQLAWLVTLPNLPRLCRGPPAHGGLSTTSLPSDRCCQRRGGASGSAKYTRQRRTGTHQKRERIKGVEDEHAGVSDSVL